MCGRIRSTHGRCQFCRKNRDGPASSVQVFDLDVPQVHEVVQGRNKADAVLVDPDPVAHPVLARIDAEASHDRAVVADRLAYHLEQLAGEARTVLERPAVLVGALVPVGHQELVADAPGLTMVKGDQVEARLAGSPRCRYVLQLEFPDVSLRQLIAGGLCPLVTPELADTPARQPGGEAGVSHARVCEFHAGQRTLLVDFVAQQGEIADIALVHKPVQQPGCLVAFHRDAGMPRRDSTPSTFGAYRPVVRFGSRENGPESCRVRRRVEAIAHQLGTDLDRLEEDVVVRITRQGDSKVC